MSSDHMKGAVKVAITKIRARLVSLAVLALLVPAAGRASSDPNVPVRLKDTHANNATQSSITIHVKNFPGSPDPQPRVTLHFNDGSGIWRDEPFGFAVNEGNYWEMAVVDAPRSAEFVLRYDVLGSTFWDNNNGQNYQMGPGFLVNGAPAACNFVGNFAAMRSTDLSWSEHAGFLSGKIIINNLGGGTVGVRYTTDNWGSFRDVFATFEANEVSGNCASVVQRFTWTDQVGNDGHGPPCINIQLAIFYFDPSGAQHWDNNFNQNYSVSACNSATAHIE